MNEMYHYKDCGLDYVWLKNGFDIVEDVYGKGVSIKNIEELHQLIANYIIDDPAPLTGPELRFLRVELDLSQKALGKYLGKTDQSVAGWEKTGNIPEEVDFLVRHIYRQTHSQKCVSYVEEVDRLQQLDRSGHRDKVALADSENGWTLTA